MHQNAARVQDALRESGSVSQVVELPGSTRTSAEAAEAIGVVVGQIAKSLVFVADGEPVLAVLSGVDRLDTERLRDYLAATAVTRADAALVREVTGFPIGGVSPIGHAGADEDRAGQRPGGLPGHLGGSRDASRRVPDDLRRAGRAHRGRDGRHPRGRARVDPALSGPRRDTGRWATERHRGVLCPLGRPRTVR